MVTFSHSWCHFSGVWFNLCSNFSISCKEMKRTFWQANILWKARMCLEMQVSSAGPRWTAWLGDSWIWWFIRTQKGFFEQIDLNNKTQCMCVSNTFFTLGQPVGNLMTKATGQLWAYVPTLMAAAVKSFLTEVPSTLVTQTRCAKNNPRDAHENDFPRTGAQGSHHYSLSFLAWKQRPKSEQHCPGSPLPGWLHSRTCLAEGVPSGHQLLILLTKGSKAPSKATARPNSNSLGS